MTKHTPTFIKFLRRFWFIWAPLVIIILALLVILVSPFSPFHRCTLIGCRDVLELTLSREPPGTYNIKVTSSTGETRNVTCTPGVISSSSPLEAVCGTGTVTFYAYTPADVTIQISGQAGQYSTSGHPDYSSFRPNGTFCPPTCRFGKLLITLP